MVWAKGILTFWNFPNRKTKLDRRPDFLEFQSSSFLPFLCQTETISKAWNKHLKVSRAAAKQSYTSFFLVSPRPRGWCIRRQVYQVLPTPFTWGLSQWENYAIQRNSALDSFSIFREFTAKKFLTVRQEPVTGTNLKWLSECLVGHELAQNLNLVTLYFRENGEITHHKFQN